MNGFLPVVEQWQALYSTMSWNGWCFMGGLTKNNNTLKNMDNNRFKTTFQLCIPVMVLCGMWVVSNLFYLYALQMYPAFYRDLGLIDVSIPFKDGIFAWHYPTPSRFSFFYFISAIITVILELWYAKKHP